MKHFALGMILGAGLIAAVFHDIPVCALPLGIEPRRFFEFSLKDRGF